MTAALHRRGFTLVELLVTMAIISIMASLILAGMYAAQEQAKEARTRALVAKLNNLIMARWETYRTRRVPVDTQGKTPAAAAKLRLDAIHELMRMELPDRWEDVIGQPPLFTDAPVVLTVKPSLSAAYLRKYQSYPTPPTVDNNSAECLYMILTTGLTDEFGGREMFLDGEIGDTDADGAPEFLDGWRNPIRFIRWPAGFLSELQTVATGAVSDTATDPNRYVFKGTTNNLRANVDNSYSGLVLKFTSGTLAGQARKIAKYTNTATVKLQFDIGNNGPNVFPKRPSKGDTFIIANPDPFDSRGVNLGGYATYPLIYSGGPDEIGDVKGDDTNRARLDQVNDPFFVDPNDGFQAGQQVDLQSKFGAKDGVNNWNDNIHNHLIGLK